MPSKKSSMNLDENVAGALCYLLTWVTGIIFYLLEKENKTVRFHAMQSIVVFLPLTIIISFFWLIPFVGWIISPLLSLLTLILWIVLIIKAYQGEKFKLPIAGDFAEKNI